ncbi:C4-type zinc ribbon domain-containing protein [Cytophagaceae bacterium ABcell3]|nr:C4-type zinc ribbon domain-containing protein [Cytophagaceae bacterium ABcell3]
MESTVAQKLEALVRLQTIDSKLVEIQKIRGDLPEEVRDLEDELAGYETRIEKYNKEIENLQQEVSNNKQAIKDAEKLIKKYEEQQMNVRNNREYDAITKEVELQNLEIQISEKRIKEAHHKIDLKNKEIEDTQGILDERKKDLQNKNNELSQIISESKDEEAQLMKEREKASKQIEERLLHSYNRIRTNTVNGLAVVSVKRDACGGCFNTVPPQRQGDIREKKKLIVCEHCGRILADVEAPVLETSKK